MINAYEIELFKRDKGTPLSDEDFEKRKKFPIDEHYRARWEKLLEDHPELSVYVRNCWFRIAGIEESQRIKSGYIPPRIAVQNLYEHYDEMLERLARGEEYVPGK
jgi:hypothetical protein